VLLFWVGFILLWLPLLAVASGMTWRYFHLKNRYLHYMVRIFQEKPLFIIPRGQPLPRAEDVRFRTSDDLTLCGCYVATRMPRRGVILFGLEFGSNRWSCWPYCEALVEAGFDIFAFESRNQGDSDSMPGYDPLQWLTEYEIRDTEAALAYLKTRPDADARGVGFFGISKGGNAGLFVASRDPYILCCVTDGAFATYTTVVPYMRQWFRIYHPAHNLQALIPDWYFGLLGRVGLGQIERERGCRFPDLEPRLKNLAPRPLLMIHGGGDTYIRPEIARALFEKARQPREFWLVPDAKHNQAVQSNSVEYRERILRFFEKHLAVALDLLKRRPSCNGNGCHPQEAGQRATVS
jgi:pimeloyl-ACP methyl ester carboxylesterase